MSIELNMHYIIRYSHANYYEGELQMKKYRINKNCIIYAKTPIEAMYRFREMHPGVDIKSIGEITINKSSLEVEGE